MEFEQGEDREMIQLTMFTEVSNVYQKISDVRQGISWREIRGILVHVSPFRRIAFNIVAGMASDQQDNEIHYFCQRLREAGGDTAETYIEGGEYIVGQPRFFTVIWYVEEVKYRQWLMEVIGRENVPNAELIGEWVADQPETFEGVSL